MAKELKFEVPPPPIPGAGEEWESLLRTLHETGTLRTLNDFFGMLGDVSGVVLDELNSPPGRGLVGGLLAMGGLLTKLPPDMVRSITTGLERGVGLAETRMDEDPPGVLELLRLLHHEDTRRALGALLSVAKSVGEELGRGTSKDRREVDEK